MTAVQSRMALSTNDLRRLDMPTFLRMERKGLANGDLRYQKSLRLERVRSWMSVMLPRETVIHLGLTNFCTSATHIRQLIKEVEGQFRTDAAEIETAPIHERRHADRLLVQGLLRRAVETNKLQTATTCAKLLISLNGTMPILVDDSAFVSDETQAARGLPDHLLIQIEQTGAAIIAEVPQFEDVDA